MPAELPDYYFRVRDNGAFVFRIGSDDRNQRIGMDQIASVNIRKGEVKPHGDRTLSDADHRAIDAWIDERTAKLARREIDDIHRTIDHLNLTTQWAQSRATDDDLNEVGDRLLLAMHDLRSVLLRKKADRPGGAGNS